MHEHQSYVGDVKFLFWKSFATNVVPAHSQIRVRKSVKKGGIDICCEHAPGNADSQTEPGRDRSSASADLQTRPTSIDASPLDVADCVCVVESRQLVIPCLGILAAIFEDVPCGLNCSDSICVRYFHFLPPRSLSAPRGQRAGFLAAIWPHPSTAPGDIT